MKKKKKKTLYEDIFLCILLYLLLLVLYLGYSGICLHHWDSVVLFTLSYPEKGISLVLFNDGSKVCLVSMDSTTFRSY